MAIPRGWTSVDAKVRGKVVHVVHTHLEPYYQPVQLAQTQKLITVPARSTLSTTVVRDLNWDATTNSTGYAMLTVAGFEDACTQTHPGEAGFTGWQSATLDNLTSILDQRGPGDVSRPT